MNESSETPRQPPRAEAIAGEFVTENFGYDGGRQVTVYLPPDPPEAIVFAGDGQMVAHWGGLLETTNVPSTMIVGVHRVADEMRRLLEYSPGFDPERFAAHEKFFVEDVSAWVRSRFGVTLSVGRTAVLGVSAGGELPLALGLRHPDRYGAIFSASPGGGYRPPKVMPSPLPRTYLLPAHWNRFPRECGSVGSRAARWQRGHRDAREDRRARRGHVARRVARDARVGLWAGLTVCNARSGARG